MARARDSLVYTTPFFLGDFDRAGTSRRVADTPVEPGSYSTSIQIHNPDAGRKVKFILTATALFAPDQEARRGNDVEVELAPRGVMFLDGAYIRAELLAGGKGAPPLDAPLFLYGALTVDSDPSAPLDVIAVCSASGFGPGGVPGGFSLQVQRAAGQLIEQPKSRK
jgi:hypothetical protein